MSTLDRSYIRADLTEKEIFEVEISEKDLVTVELKTIDVVYKNVDSDCYDAIFEKIIYNETPTKLTASLFQTAHAYRTGKLKVYLNGVKIHDSEITEESSTTFSLDNYSTDSEDLIEVSYIKA